MKQTLVAILASMTLAGTAAAQPATQKPMQGEAPSGEMSLGTVTIPRAVTADGKPLPRGQYQVRLTAQEPTPDVPGIERERWVEFIQGGQVRGREVVSIVPANEMKDLMEGPDSARGTRGGNRVEMLKGNDYLRVWINRGGVAYLIHMPPAAG